MLRLCPLMPAQKEHEQYKLGICVKRHLTVW